MAFSILTRPKRVFQRQGMVTNINPTENALTKNVGPKKKGFKINQNQVRALQQSPIHCFSINQCQWGGLPQVSRRLLGNISILARFAKERVPNYINFSYCPRLVRHQGVAWDGPEVKVQEKVTRLLSLLSVPLVWGGARAHAGPARLPLARASLLCPQHSRLELQPVFESTFSVIRLTIRLLSKAFKSALHCSKKVLVGN